MAGKYWGSELKKRKKKYEKTKKSWFVDDPKILTGLKSRVKSATKKKALADSLLKKKKVAKKK